MTANYNLELVQGDSLNETLAITGLVLTGYSAKGQMRRDNSSTATSFTMTISNDKKSITWYLSPTASAALVPGIYQYQIEITASTLNMTILKGSITVLPEVSK